MHLNRPWFDNRAKWWPHLNSNHFGLCSTRLRLFGLASHCPWEWRLTITFLKHTDVVRSVFCCHRPNRPHCDEHFFYSYCFIFWFCQYRHTPWVTIWQANFTRRPMTRRSVKMACRWPLPVPGAPYLLTLISRRNQSGNLPQPTVHVQSRVKCSEVLLPYSPD
jgi:hypothetical protein